MFYFFILLQGTVLSSISNKDDTSAPAHKEYPKPAVVEPVPVSKVKKQPIKGPTDSLEQSRKRELSEGVPSPPGAKPLPPKVSRIDQIPSLMTREDEQFRPYYPSSNPSHDESGFSSYSDMARLDQRVERPLQSRIDEIYEKRKREILGTSIVAALGGDVVGAQPVGRDQEYNRRKMEILGGAPDVNYEEYERRRREILDEPFHDRLLQSKEHPPAAGMFIWYY